MRVVVTGASGNVGTSLLAALAQDSRVEEIEPVLDARTIGSRGRRAGDVRKEH